MVVFVECKLIRSDWVKYEDMIGYDCQISMNSFDGCLSIFVVLF
jgi:hypothetical protein